MKKFGFLALLGAFTAVANAQFSIGNIVVARVGDGVAALSSSAAAVNIDQFTTAGSLVNTTGITGLTMSGSATSEGYMTIVGYGGDASNVTNYGVSFGGYSTAAGTAGSVVTTTGARRAGVLRFNNTQSTVDLTAGTTPFSGVNIRGVAYNGVSNTYFAVGNGTGVVRADGTGASTVASSTTTNIRTVQYFGNDLFYGTGSGTTRGVYMTPGGATGSAITSTNIVNLGGAAAASDFEIFRDATGTPVSALVVDEGTGAAGGLWLATGWTGTTFGAPTQIMTAAAMSTALGGGTLGIRQFSVVGTDIYATTVEASNNRLVKLSFAGGFAGGLTSANTLATAGSNMAFRGVEVVPEPASFAVIGLGLIGLAARRRRNK